MRKALSQILDPVIDLLFPLSCVVCKREGRFLCEGCETTLPRLESPHCSICANPGGAPVCAWCAAIPPAFDGIRAPYLLDGPITEMVYGLKYRNLRSWAPGMGRLMATHIESSPDSADLLVPVPLHRRRERDRGYNQSELLAREVSELTAIPLEPEVLSRTRDTPPQISMTSQEDRRRNMEGAFACTASVGGRRVLLVDDVVTTGATMSACARELKAAGAASVWGLALAR